MAMVIVIVMAWLLYGWVVECVNGAKNAIVIMYIQYKRIALWWLLLLSFVFLFA